MIWNKSVRFLAKRLLQKTQKSQTLSYRRCAHRLYKCHCDWNCTPIKTYVPRAKSKGNSDKPQCPSDRDRTDSNKSFKSILCVIWNKSVRFLAKRLLQKTQKSQTLSHRRCTSSLQMPLRLELHAH